MNLFLIRHGEAEPPGSSSPTDADRALTQRGRVILRYMATTLQQRGVCPARILSSPFLRAHETAQILRTGLQCAPEILLMGELSSGASPHTMIQLAEAHRHEGDLLIVGHNPEISGAVGFLNGSSGRPADPMRPGTLAWFQCSGPLNEGNAVLHAQWDAETLAAEAENLLA